MKKIKEVLENILKSLKNNDEGYSARKLSALIVIIMAVILHIKWFRADKWEYVGEILAFDYTFILTCLGLTTWQAIKEKQNDVPKE
jgi:hypothetical protein